MTKALFLMLVLLFALSASASLSNELTNGSWQSGDDTGWVRAGGEIVNLVSWFANPGPAPGEADVYGYGLATSWGTGDGSISQDIYSAPGVYDIFLNGWLCAKDGWGFSSWIELQLSIDDQIVAAEQVSASGGDTGWVSKQILWTGYIAQKKSVRIVAHVDGREAGPDNWPWGIVYADGIVLGQRTVPEPASVLALLTGIAGIAGITIRRRG